MVDGVKIGGIHGEGSSRQQFPDSLSGLTFIRSIHRRCRLDSITTATYD